MSKKRESVIFDLPPDYWNERFWKLSVRDPVGDSSPDPLFHASGKATSTWEFFETMVSKIFVILTESRSQAALRAFGSQMSSSGRCAMVEYAAEVFFGRKRAKGLNVDEQEEAVRLLLKTHQHASAVRNNIAHGLVVKVERSQGEWWFLVPPLYNAVRRAANPDVASLSAEDLQLAGSKYVYTGNNVSEFEKRFQQMAFATWKLQHWLETIPEA